VVFSGSSANKTDRNDITEILLKVALNTIKQTNKPKQLPNCLHIAEPSIIVIVFNDTSPFLIIERHESGSRKDI
jgi:hypothetical protein